MVTKIITIELEVPEKFQKIVADCEFAIHCDDCIHYKQREYVIEGNEED